MLQSPTDLGGGYPDQDRAGGVAGAAGRAGRGQGEVGPVLCWLFTSLKVDVDPRMVAGCKITLMPDFAFLTS